MVVSKFTKLCNYHYKSILEYFISPNKISHAPLPLFPVSTPAPGTHSSILYRFSFSGHLI